MKNKYYTPTIEEFCIGFEYEELSNVGSWYKTQFGDNNGEYNNELSECYWNITHDKIRVKYLDKEDIESLGFKLKGKSIDLWFEKEGIYLRDDGYHLNNIKLQYGLHDNNLKITFNYVAGEEQIHFEGKIKNKTELKKLLKQLEIEDEKQN